MTQVESQNFGLLIAYLTPGFLAIAGLSDHFQGAKAWLGTGQSSPTVGGFLFATIASVAAGLVASTLRWLILDHIHARTGLSPPPLDFAKLQANVDAFQAVIEYHYRYYQFYGNSMVSMAVVAIFGWPLFGGGGGAPTWLGLLLVLARMTLFFFASRDALRKYYVRLTALYSTSLEAKETKNDKRRAPPEDGDETDEAAAAHRCD